MPAMSRRQLLFSLPALAMAPRSLLARPVVAALQAGTAPIRVRTLSHFGLAVSDPKRSVEFYQGLFGMPVQARQGANDESAFFARWQVARVQRGVRGQHGCIRDARRGRGAQTFDVASRRRSRAGLDTRRQGDHVHVNASDVGA